MIGSLIILVQHAVVKLARLRVVSTKTHIQELSTITALQWLQWA